MGVPEIPVVNEITHNKIEQMKCVYATGLQSKRVSSARLHRTDPSSPAMTRHMGRMLRKIRSRNLIQAKTECCLKQMGFANLTVRHSRKARRICPACSKRFNHACRDPLVPKEYWDRLYDLAFEALNSVPFNDFFEVEDSQVKVPSNCLRVGGKTG